MKDELGKKRHDQHRAIADGLVQKWVDSGNLPQANPIFAHEIAYAMDTVRRAGHQDIVSGADGSLVAPIPTPESDPVQHIARSELTVVEHPQSATPTDMPNWTPVELAALSHGLPGRSVGPDTSESELHGPDVPTDEPALTGSESQSAGLFERIFAGKSTGNVPHEK